MSRKHMRWGVAFILAGLMLRAFVPFGFMPIFGPGYSAKLVMCDSYARLPWTTASISMDMSRGMPIDATMDMAGHHHPDDTNRGRPPVHHDHTSCPYGSSPLLGALPVLAVSPVVAQCSSKLAVAAPQVAYFGVSPRAQSPRGPPA
jgi:hypothetical protein